MGKKKVKDKIIISGKDLVINSAGKQGRHLDIVKTGCGVHESKKRKMQKRKGKYAQRLKKELKGYSWDAVILLLSYSTTG